ncbi:hypothetical protein PENANT_c086G07577 [Penicillium antarcticum]|uniref:Uncharacterized protein n=1 Tax=Penicillium antarcticum TaxID=416450 RepID=A0A1V6PMK1_9EURO|nr:uncharacterized protein N7508_007350 [Penicillium antarcticum]KAJ5300107.1 hypothetical protein N7508_007350 [Penicillium antarcticum]OQD78123.1 hypothetical protein PENANT_c086G07577 [Penicillium antarcticum]
MSNTQPQCACSAFFETELNLHEHLEEYRSREQRLQAELERCRAHSRPNGDDCRGKDDNDQGESDDDQHIYDKDAGNPMSTIRKTGASKGRFCPSCERAKPFPKMQGLRRHFQQRKWLVSEFIRHADRHDGACERKRSFIKKTCDELREQSDKQLALAISQCRSSVLVGKKRKWEVAALGSDISGAQAKFDRIGMTALDQSLFSQSNEGDSFRQLGQARDELSAPLIPMQSPIALPRLSTMVDTVNPNSSSNMSTEEIYFNPGEGQTQDLDLLQDFDAPILQIMNSIPALSTGWAAQDDFVDITTEAAVYRE